MASRRDASARLKTVRRWWSCPPCDANVTVEIEAGVESWGPSGFASRIMAIIDHEQRNEHSDPGCELTSGTAETRRLIE